MSAPDFQPSSVRPTRGGGPARYRKPLFLLLALALLLGLARIGDQYIPQAALWIEGLGFWGPAAFIGLYVLATVLFIPGSILTLAGGAIFGLAEGVAYVFVGALLGSVAAFLLARHGARKWIEGRVTNHPRFGAISQAVAREGLKITFLLRLSPIFPFNFLNYALGLTRMSLRDYVIASLGMLPMTLLYVYYGRVIGDVASLAAGATPDRGGGYYLLLSLGLVATVAVTAVVTRSARRALRNIADVEETEDVISGGGETGAT